MSFINEVFMPWSENGVLILVVAGIVQMLFMRGTGWKKWISCAASLCGIASLAWVYYGVMDWVLTDIITTALQHQTPGVAALIKALSGPALPAQIQAYLPRSHWGEYADLLIATSSIQVARQAWNGIWMSGFSTSSFVSADSGQHNLKSLRVSHA